MLEINLEIPGTPATKKNSLVAFCRGGKPVIIQSKQYRDYEKMALVWLLQYGNQFIPGQVEVRTIYYLPNRRKRDLTNLMACTHDVLEKAGLIEDDALIVSVDGSRQHVDPGRPRVEIRIRQAFDRELSLEIDKHIILTDAAKGN